MILTEGRIQVVKPVAAVVFSSLESSSNVLVQPKGVVAGRENMKSGSTPVLAQAVPLPTPLRSRLFQRRPVV